MTFETYNFSDDFQDAILSCLIRFPDKFWRFGEIIKPEYFNGSSAVEVVYRLKDYVAKYGNYPNFTTLGNYVFVRTERKNPERAKELIDYVVKLSQVDCGDVDAVLDLSVKFAKERAIFDGLRKIHLAQQEGKENTVDAVKTMEEAMKVGFDYEDLGIELSRDLDKIIDKMTNINYGIHTGYTEFDKLWKNGWPAGHLIVLLAPPKGYKCLGKGTKILMFDGSVKPVEKIKVGDLLMGDDSKPRRVQISGKGRGKLYKIKQNNGIDYVCNDEHILCLQKQDGTIAEIPAKNYVSKCPWFKRTWKAYKTGVNFTKKKLPLEPYFLGLWLGDGTAAAPHVTVGKKDIEIASYLRAYAEKLGIQVRLIEGTGCHTMCLARKKSGKYKIKTNPILVNLKKLGLINNKHIPNVYKLNNRQGRLELLAGLLDSDGCLGKKGFTFVNTNKTLVNETAWIARSLGFSVRIHKTIARITSRNFTCPAWHVSINGKISEIPTKLPRKKASNSVKRTLRCGISVENLGIGDYYGFTIDGNGRFLLEDFTVTHNTTFAINLALKMASDQAINADVLYYACEIKQEEAAMRAIYNLTGKTEAEMWEGVEKFKMSARSAVDEKMWGNFFFKSFPAKTTTIAQIRTHAKQVIRTFGLKPKALFIDYADTVKPNTSNKNIPDWRQQADIYTEARAIGDELGCCVVMPDRCNKETVGRKVPSVASFQGSFEKGGVVDAAIGLCATDAEYKQNKMRFFVFLNRHGPQNQQYIGTVNRDKYQITIDKKIEYNPDEEDEDDDRFRKGRKSSAAKFQKEVTPHGGVPQYD
jgi:hypothetical protein